MHLEDQRSAALVQAIHEPAFPQRVASVESLGPFTGGGRITPLIGLLAAGPSTAVIDLTPVAS